MSHEKQTAIAIDGPAGAGKSTIAKLVAKELGFIYVDTGAMYRAMAIHFLGKGITLEAAKEMNDESAGAIGNACEDAEVSIRFEDGVQHVYLNGQDVTGGLRTQEVGDMASATSVLKAVRTRLVALQQNLAAKTPVVMDGRDIGTVVLPDAKLKIYLTASVEERASRRFKELSEKGETPVMDEIVEEIRERDHRDTTRAESPLRKADDAVEVDTSDLTIPEVTARILDLWKNC